MDALIHPSYIAKNKFRYHTIKVINYSTAYLILNQWCNELQQTVDEMKSALREGCKSLAMLSQTGKRIGVKKHPRGS